METTGRGASALVEQMGRTGKREGGATVTPAPVGPLLCPGTPALPRVPSVEERLFTEGCAFHFFQAVRLLERLTRARKPGNRKGGDAEVNVRFRTHLSFNFPPSEIYEIGRPTPVRPMPVVTVWFMGLTGTSGVLPYHYTEKLIGLDRGATWPQQSMLRDFLDLFNDRLISLFYGAWAKYRFYLAYERGEHTDPQTPDPFTRCLLSLVGLGEPPLRNRLQVVSRNADDDPSPAVLARVDDLVLLHYSGLLSQRRRCAVGLRALLQDYFQLPMHVEQFQGQWLHPDPANQSRRAGVGIITGCASTPWPARGCGTWRANPHPRRAVDLPAVRRVPAGLGAGPPGPITLPAGSSGPLVRGALPGFRRAARIEGGRSARL